MNIFALPGGRAGGRLRRAREFGYLNAACDRTLTQWHSRWCWRLRIPVIWMERCSPRSKYGRLHLDLFTTPYALTREGRDALRVLSNRLGIQAPDRVSAHDACWAKVPIESLELLAHAVLRALTRPANWQLDLPRPARHNRPGEVVEFPDRATA